MKNLNIFLVVAIAATSILSSCNSNNPKTPQLKNENDSISYALGLTQGSSIKSYYIQGDSISQDSINKKINSLLKGINDGMKKVKTDNAELTTLAENIGNSLREQKNTGLLGDTNLIVNMKLIKQGLINGLYKSNIQMTPEEAQNYLNTTMQKLNEIKLETQYGANKNTGKLFLEENAKKEGIITTESGLQYEVITLGKGEKPTETSRVKVHYHGTLIDGSVFDSSVERGEPAVFGVNQVIKGWTEALQLMPVGSKFKLYIPYDLAYGSQNAGSIEPFSTLIFDVELISIEK